MQWLHGKDDAAPPEAPLPLAPRVAVAAQSSPEPTPPPLGPARTRQVFLPLIKLPRPEWAIIYYVDSASGSDHYSCLQAQNPATPKKSVSGVMSCDPGPGETVRLRGEFKETIFPTRSGTVLYDVQDIEQVDGSVVTFNQPIVDVSSAADYVAIYGSRRGNSGAFAVLRTSGNQVTVDTSSLPAGRFLPETDADPGDLQAAILRPVHFTAWDNDNPPVYSGEYQAYHVINQRVIMVSHIKSVAGDAVNRGFNTWPAFKIDGRNGGNSDFQILDHLEVTNAECGFFTESAEFNSSYDIIQFNTLHDLGYGGNIGHDVFIYWGFAYRNDLHHDFVQIMYNKLGPFVGQGAYPNPMRGAGIELKHSVRGATVFGNEIFGINSNACDNAPIKVSGPYDFVANNYVHDINGPDLSCGISIVNDMTPYDPKLGGYGAIVANNIIANVKRVGIQVLDTNNVQILNNTIYGISPEPNCDAACMEQNMGIGIYNLAAPTHGIVITNNIVQSSYIGIGRYIWSTSPTAGGIHSDYNLVFDAVFPFHGVISQNAHDIVADPGLVSPQSGNFALTTASPARASGVDLSAVFAVDNHDAADPRLPVITPPTIRPEGWDRGSYQHEASGGPAQGSP